MSTHRLFLFAALLVVVALVVVACGPSATPTPAAAPTKGPAPASTVAATPGAAAPGKVGSPESGKAVFEANCNGCHPGGNKGNGPDIRGKSADVVKNKVRNGGGGMPQFSQSQISDQQLTDVAAYVNSLK